MKDVAKIYLVNITLVLRQNIIKENKMDKTDILKGSKHNVLIKLIRLWLKFSKLPIQFEMCFKSSLNLT